MVNKCSNNFVNRIILLDAVSIPDSAAIPLIAQPEMEATNGMCLLNFKYATF